MIDVTDSEAVLVLGERSCKPAPARESSSTGWLRYIFGFPIMLGVVLAGTTYFCASHSIADPDIWWHLRNAETLVQTGHIVSHDTYSFTANGARWMNHEWLAELPYYFAWHFFGFRGLYLVMLGCVETILMGVFYLCYRTSRNVKAAFLVSWVAVPLATVSFGPRTLLFGWIYLIIELIILYDFREGKDRTWLLPFLFLCGSTRMDRG